MSAVPSSACYLTQPFLSLLTIERIVFEITVVDGSGCQEEGGW